MDMIQHSAVVQFVRNGRATIAVSTDGCSSCGHSSGCGLSRLVKNDADATALMVVDAEEGIHAGDQVTLQLAPEHMTYTVLLGYLFPTLALLVGSGVAMEVFQTDGAAALGAIAGFLIALLLARLAVPVVSRMMPAPRLIPLSPMEHHHER